MRSRRVPARREQRDLDLIGRRRDRARLDGHLADLQPRVAVQREDSRHPGERACGDGVDGATGHELFGGLEDQPNADGKFGHRRQRERRAEQHCGVAVVPARVSHIGHRRRVGRTAALGHW